MVQCIQWVKFHHARVPTGFKVSDYYWTSTIFFLLKACANEPIK